MRLQPDQPDAFVNANSRNLILPSDRAGRTRALLVNVEDAATGAAATGPIHP